MWAQCETLKLIPLIIVLFFNILLNFFYLLQARFLLSKVNPSQTHNNMYAYGGVRLNIYNIFFVLFLKNLHELIDWNSKKLICIKSEFQCDLCNATRMFWSAITAWFELTFCFFLFHHCFGENQAMPIPSAVEIFFNFFLSVSISGGWVFYKYMLCL